MAESILIVEDSPIVLKIMQHLLEKHQIFFPVFVATYGEAEIFLESQEHPFFAAVVDLNLPDAPHGEIVDLVLSYQIPCIVLSGSYDDQRRIQLQDKGIVDYIVKESRVSYEFVIKLLERLVKNQHVKILVADDSKSSRSFCKKALHLHLYQMLEAETGLQALNILHEQPDIKMLIVDYNMPEMDGYELVKTIRHKDNNKSLCIIGVSGMESGSLSARFIKMGANDFLKKPFYQEELHCRVMHNIEEMELIAKIQDTANRDYLTGLFNRRYFVAKAEEYLQTALQENRHLSFALLDIDFFKGINDRYGHDVGDQVLKKMGLLLAEKFRRFLVARLGGEEFCILMPGMDIEHSAQLLSGFKNYISDQSIDIENETLSFTISIGVTEKLKPTLLEMMTEADRLLYRAKEAGRNLVITSDAYIDADDE
ncbi:GGDEF domain-containing response regulator [Zooshikella harenae]|uniref:diguanylate cyclase n=1 Tax=Zooshikella harenae TaxID=2827238 RepID=A0ABS5ZCQ5_9GAMM|nr:diguanylate cyclase [Zooshikella harenae]MBU2711842.1 diguanylate cyclase [Zooshikella harenae]